MDQNNKISKKFEEKIHKSNVIDSILKIFKVGLSATTFSPLSSLISNYIPDRRFLRLEKFSEELSEELSRIEDNIDENFITTDEFAFIFEQCFKAVSENYQKDKLDSFKAIIINSAIDRKIGNEEREYFLNLTNSLTILHLRVLKFLYSPHDYLTQNNIAEDYIQGSFGNFFPKVFPEVNLETIKMAFEDLYNY